MLRKGQGEVGELSVGDGLALAEEALDHGPGLAAKQLHYDGLVALEVVYPVSPRRRHVLLVLAVLLRHSTRPRNLGISIITNSEYYFVK